MGGVYPNQAFTGFIPSKSINASSGTPPLDGRTVSITGAVQLYKRQVEIVVDSPSQLKVEKQASA
jgi:DNA/RNA endonuclease YhcR with UshA esterase domain